jgi:Immunoglobulin I-set domain.
MLNIFILFFNPDVCSVNFSFPILIEFKMKMSCLIFLSNFVRYQMREYEENGFHISELTIPNTEKTDAGMYTCTASNPYGRDQSTIHFTVQGM